LDLYILFLRHLSHPLDLLCQSILLDLYILFLRRLSHLLVLLHLLVL
jgi:hypothetical protein